MSEDGIFQLPTDLAGERQAPGGIFQLGDQPDNHVSLDHGVTLICDSHRTLVTRLAVNRKHDRKRIHCPECGRMATVYIRQGAT